MQWVGPEKMLITRETDYAIRTVVYLARESDRVANVAEVAEAMRIPKSFLAKIVQRLAKKKLVESLRGVHGGFRLAMDPKEITVLAILEAIQGVASINMCVAGRGKCGLSPTCAVHPIWVDMREEVERRLRDQTIARLLEG